jgi:hypothetical protein
MSQSSFALPITARPVASPRIPELQDMRQSRRVLPRRRFARGSSSLMINLVSAMSARRRRPARIILTNGLDQVLLSRVLVAHRSPLAGPWFNVTVPGMCCLPQRTNASNTSPRARPFGVSV